MPPQQQAWRLEWLTPWRCRFILVAVLALGFLSHLRYLTHNCPLDLSGDEAHYWDWSRQLDLSYYSKGPAVAYLMRASCAIFGDTMPAVRLPALVLAIGTSLATYWLTKKLFGSERLALGAALLNHLVPMFIAGSVMMTIDPPLFFCWAMATCFAAKAIFDGAKWAWIAMGIAVGLGFLAKYSMPLWFVGLLVFMLLDPSVRPRLRTVWPWVAVVVFLVFTIPVILWNARNGWVSFYHVARQTAAVESEGGWRSVLDMLASQLAAVGPPLAILFAAAVIYALGRRGGEDPCRRQMRFLTAIGLSFFAIVLSQSFRAKVQANWPAPAYFTLMILSAYFLGTRLANAGSWKRWRWCLWSAVGLGIAVVPVAHDSQMLYPLAARISRMISDKQPRANWDLSARLRGWDQVGQRVSRELAALSNDPFVLAEEYQVCSELAFYVKGQPRTYYVGSYFLDPKRRNRHSQFDFWPDRRLDRSQLRDRDAIYVGYEPPPELEQAFASMESLPDEDIDRSGLHIKTFRLWRCHGFKGMTRPADDGKF
jgi:4-amino-4-deoxy-L-arabinose transferase-like glycosyltransferase